MKGKDTVKIKKGKEQWSKIKHHLIKLIIQKFMRCEKLATIIARQLTITFEQSWQLDKVPNDQKKEKVNFISIRKATKITCGNTGCAPHKDCGVNPPGSHIRAPEVQERRPATITTFSTGTHLQQI